jgi:GlpG protein
MKNEQHAQRLSEYLYAQGASNEIREEEDVFEIWVHQDAHLEQARAALAQFRDDPEATEFVEGAAKASELRRSMIERDEEYQRNFKTVDISLSEADGRSWLTIAVMVMSIAIALVSGLGGELAVIDPLMMSEQPISAGFPEIRAGQLWRFLTPAIVHFGLMHLCFNLLMWWSFAQRIEARKGFAFTLVLVITAQLASDAGQIGWTAISNPGGGAYFGGLSGIVYALFGYIWFKGRADPADGLSMPDNVVLILIGWLFLCMTGLVGPVANGAHVGGLIWGGAVAAADVMWSSRRRGR